MGMKGYKGFEKGLICKGKQYAENTVFEEDNAEICKSGMHFCDLPHRVFQHYSAGENHEFAVVEALDDVQTDDNAKYCTKKLKIGTKINVFDICKMSVSAAFEKFEFEKKINEAKESLDNNAGNWGAANAGNWGAANAGDGGAANAGNCGAANAGNWGAANAGDWGAANAGNCGAANAGNCGAANAGNWGAAIVRKGGTASAGKNGVAIGLGNGSMAKGEKNSVLVLVEFDDNGDISHYKAVKVDGEKILEDAYYKLKNGRLVKARK